ncbi:hypothetical protein IOD13_05045 [Brevibacterium casei]|nr:hypothetical protein [Brevibacterium casei]
MRNPQKNRLTRAGITIAAVLITVFSIVPASTGDIPFRGPHPRRGPHLGTEPRPGRAACDRRCTVEQGQRADRRRDPDEGRRSGEGRCSREERRVRGEGLSGERQTRHIPEVRRASIGSQRLRRQRRHHRQGRR